MIAAETLTPIRPENPHMKGTAYESLMFNYDQIDAGVRDVVRLLREAGFNTRDSGDGSKAATMACALDYPHVFMVIDPDDALAEAKRCWHVLQDAGLAAWDVVARTYPDGLCLLCAVVPQES